MLKTFCNILLDMVYPPRCPACRRRIKTHGAWCDACLKELMNVVYFSTLKHKYNALDECLSLYRYRGKLKRIIHDMKFRNDQGKKRQLSYLAQYALNTIPLKNSIDMVIPVPLDVERLKIRGFNQTELIFRAWCEKSELTWRDDILLRTKKAKPQWQLSRPERKSNLQGVFKVIKPEAVKDKTILLVDDIITTGMTLKLCAAELKKAKAGFVIGLALAH